MTGLLITAWVALAGAWVAQDADAELLSIVLLGVAIGASAANVLALIHELAGRP